jgi:hypothetical protein
MLHGETTRRGASDQSRTDAVRVGMMYRFATEGDTLKRQQGK